MKIHGQVNIISEVIQFNGFYIHIDSCFLLNPSLVGAGQTDRQDQIFKGISFYRFDQARTDAGIEFNPDFFPH